MGHFEMKNVAAPVQVFAVRGEGLTVPRGQDLKGKAKRLTSTGPKLSRTIRMAAVGFIAMAIGATLFWTLIGGQVEQGEISAEESIKWAYQTAIPQLEALVGNLYIHQKYAGYGPDAWKAFELAQKLEKILPDEPKVSELKAKCSKNISIVSHPAGVKVYAKGYSQADTAFQLMGTTPIENVSFPSSYVNLQLEKEGYHAIEDVILVNEMTADEWTYQLDSLGTIPENMSMVRPHLDTLFFRGRGLQRLLRQPDEYLIDRYEVSNREYLAFIKAGGYQNREYWQESFFKDGKKINWEEAMSIMVDQTDQPGPSTWIGGIYPEGEDNFPVEGVSWYEAAAYARFAGKQLPSRAHLVYLAGTTGWVGQEMMEESHLNAKRTRERSADRGLNLWGVHDIFGNVREWCYNVVDDNLRENFGAAYSDEDYTIFHIYNARQPMDRSSGNGFRCIQSKKYAAYSTALYDPIKSRTWRDYYQETPVSDEVFNSYLNYFAYDRQKLNPTVIYSREETHWIREKVEFEAPYGNERMAAYLFLPKNAVQPYQTLLYWPGATAWRMNSSEEFLELGQVDFLIKNGRAIVFPIIAGTYERKNASENDCKNWRVCDKNNAIKFVQEFQKTLDYLETRSDIDMGKIAFIGKSAGATRGPMPMAVEPRFKAGIYHLGGLQNFKPFPEVDVFNYCPRVTQPVLMLHGRFDPSRPYKESLLPTYELLGTLEKDKDLKLYNEAHMVPKKEFIKESLAFLDRYFGKVEYSDVLTGGD